MLADLLSCPTELKLNQLLSRHGRSLSVSVFTISKKTKHNLDSIAVLLLLRGYYDWERLTGQQHEKRSLESCSPCQVSQQAEINLQVYVELTDASLSVSALAAPTPPAGFDVDIHYDTSKRFNLLSVYLTAIDCMYSFAQEDWNKQQLDAFTILSPRSDIQIDIEPFRDTIQLEVNHIVFGLYDTILDVAEKSRFCETLSTLSLHRRLVGTLRIEKMTPRILDGGINAPNLTVVKGLPQSNGVTYPTGRLQDPDNPEFSIDYIYYGARINSKDIFLAILDALATAAQFSDIEPFESLRAASPSGPCVVNLVGVDGPIKTNYSFVTKALRMTIVGIMVKLGKFEEIALRLKWEGSLIAEGSVKLTDRGAVAQE